MLYKKSQSDSNEWCHPTVADYAMLPSMFGISALFKLMHTVFDVFIDVMTFFGLCLRPPATLAAETLFLR